MCLGSVLTSHSMQVSSREICGTFKHARYSKETKESRKNITKSQTLQLLQHAIFSLSFARQNFQFCLTLRQLSHFAVSIFGKIICGRVGQPTLLIVVINAVVIPFCVQRCSDGLTRKAALASQEAHAEEKVLRQRASPLAALRVSDSPVKMLDSLAVLPLLNCAEMGVATKTVTCGGRDEGEKSSRSALETHRCYRRERHQQQPHSKGASTQWKQKDGSEV